MSLNKRLLFLIIALLLIMASIFIFFIASFNFPPGDDPAVHNAMIETIIEKGEKDFVPPFYPQLERKEPYHLVSVGILTILDLVIGIRPIIVLNHYLIAFLFCSSVVFLFLLYNYFVKSVYISLIGVIFVLWSHWGQEIFFEGNYSQIISFIYIPLIIFLFDKYLKTKNLNYLIIGLFLGVIQYYVEAFSFLLFVIFLLSWFFVYNPLKIKTTHLFIIATLITLSFIALINFMPTFAVEQRYYSIKNLLSSTEGIESSLIFFLLLFGFIFVIKKKSIAFLWIACTFILSQATLIGTPIFSWRYNSYFFQSLGLVLSMGIHQVTFFIQNKKIKVLIPTILIVILLINALPYQNYIKTINMKYTIPYNPPVVLQDDIRAMNWIEENIPKDSVFMAPKKWGIYIPAIAKRKAIVYPYMGPSKQDPLYNFLQELNHTINNGDVQDLFNFSCEHNITHFYWSASLYEYPYAIKEIVDKDALLQELENSTYFKKIYDNKTKIYLIKC